MCECVHTRVSVHVHVCARVNMCACAHIHVHVSCVCMHTYACVRVCVRMCVRVCGDGERKHIVYERTLYYLCNFSVTIK